MEKYNVVQEHLQKLRFLLPDSLGIFTNHQRDSESCQTPRILLSKLRISACVTAKCIVFKRFVF